jgi:hypothetical protein
MLERFTVITEVVAIDRKRSKKFGLKSGHVTSSDDLKKKGFKHISSDTHHDYYANHGVKNDAYIHNATHYIAHNKTTNRIEQHVSGKQNKAKNFHISTLSGAHGATVKAHDFYHHLIKKHNISLSTDKQSTGGRNVWEKLRKKRGIGVHGWDPKTKKAVNVHSGDDEAYHHEKSRDKSDGAKRLHLVAHKK